MGFTYKETLVMINPNSIMENVNRNMERPYVVRVMKYGNRVFNVQESTYYDDKDKALEEAKKIKPPVNCFVEVREKLNESFQSDKSVIWRSDRLIEAGTKGDYGLNPDTSSGGPKEGDTPKEIKHEAGDTAKLKKEKTPNPGSHLPEGKAEEATKKDNKSGRFPKVSTAKLPLKQEKAPNKGTLEAKKKDDKKDKKMTKEGKVPSNPTGGKEGDMIKELTEGEDKEEG